MGAQLYSLGGFKLPFVCVDSVGLILAVSLLFVIPSGKYEGPENNNGNNTKHKLTLAAVTKV